MALHYPCEKGLVVLFKLLRHEQGFNKLPRTHGAWLEHICLITGCSLIPNHPKISGAWIAPAWWPIAVSANQGNTSSIIQDRFSFKADAMQLCIKHFLMLVHVHDHQVWLHDRLHKASWEKVVILLSESEPSFDSIYFAVTLNDSKSSFVPCHPSAYRKIVK